jgi:hypothetical protein
MVPVVLADTHGAFDGLRAGAHYLHGIPERVVSPQDTARIGRSAFDWYQDHRVDAHAQATSALLQGR